MRSPENQAPQGDVHFHRRVAIPEGFAAIEPINGQYIVTHSETGHHHTVDAADAVLYQGSNPLVAYLRLESDSAEVIHRRGFDTHESIGLGGGVGAVWEVRRQREYDPEGERRAAD